eukprot:TRINITY_DN76961_c0_g1_i1.p1 TRINITY_DN76961_c0_g1~~TRINITY_DN76961_c0_g1_i1.p1  ORF type:complete len:389 (-),score=54.62 TRINITY_DN76961_c0_g1_i1:30-1196(-)
MAADTRCCSQCLLDLLPFGRNSCIGECLVPNRTFGHGPRAHKTLWWARALLFALYSFIAFVLLVCGWCFIMGRIEIVDHRMKFSRLEAPSIAICPWNAGAAIVKHPNASYMIHALQVTLKGITRLPNEPRDCQFDRICVCLDLKDVYLNDVSDSHHGPTGVESVEAQTFRENIEIRTTLMDPSPHKTLKIGFYDSMDHRPSWFYSPQWYFLIGQLRLDSWMVSEENNRNLHAIFTANWTEIDRRHFYNFDFSSTPGTPNQRFTRLRYEYRTFFVMETISSQRTLSLFTVVCLLIVIVGVSQALIVWEFLFPVYVDGQVQKRTVARPLQWVSKNIFCIDLEHAHECEDSDSSKGSNLPMLEYGSVSASPALSDRSQPSVKEQASLKASA